MNTIAREYEVEFEEKKSKFIGYAKPISSKEDAEFFIEFIKMKHPNASHNCSAYKVIENGQEYYKVDDDGEPSGTAGKPMGEILNLLEVDNLVVVATRYYGGIKLGAGGLVRNYAKTAKLAVNEAGIIEYIEKKRYVVDFSYDKVDEIENIIGGLGGNIYEKEYLDKVTYRAELNKDIVILLQDMKDVIIFEI